MKKLALLIIMALTMVGCSAVAEAAEYTDTEKAFVAQLYERRQILKDLADGITDETVPIKVKVLEQERAVIIAQRDADIQTNNVNNDNANQVVTDAAQVLINAVNSNISSLLNSL